MDFAFSPEQQELRAAARQLLAGSLPAHRVSELADSAQGWDPESWPQLASQGWLGMSTPEERGGLGLTTLDEAVLFEEAGAALYPGPFFSTVALSVPLLQAAGDAGADLISGVIKGDQIFTLAWAESRGDSVAETDLATRFDHGVLTGKKKYVPDLALATDVLVTAQGSAGPQIHAVSLADASLTDTPSIQVIPRPTSDLTRRVGELVLQGAASTLLLSGEAAAQSLRAMRLRAMSAAALESVGVAQFCLTLATSYANEREQFGRPIGTNQAISHQIADVFSATELARSLAYWAAWSVQAQRPNMAQAVLAAKSRASEAAIFAAEVAIQVHGGIAFTWEHVLHRYYKRAQGLAAFEGPPSRLRAELAATLLGPELGPERGEMI